MEIHQQNMISIFSFSVKLINEVTYQFSFTDAFPVFVNDFSAPERLRSVLRVAIYYVLLQVNTRNRFDLQWPMKMKQTIR